MKDLELKNVLAVTAKDALAEQVNPRSNARVCQGEKCAIFQLKERRASSTLKRRHSRPDATL